MSLHQELINNDIQCDSYTTDLQFVETEISLEILEKYPLFEKNAEYFISQVDGKAWVEVPFAFEKGLVKNSPN